MNTHTWHKHIHTKEALANIQRKRQADEHRHTRPRRQQGWPVGQQVSETEHVLLAASREAVKKILLGLGRVRGQVLIVHSSHEFQPMPTGNQAACGTDTTTCNPLVTQSRSRGSFIPGLSRFPRLPTTSAYLPSYPPSPHPHHSFLHLPSSLLPPCLHPHPHHTHVHGIVTAWKRLKSAKKIYIKKSFCDVKQQSDFAGFHTLKKRKRKKVSFQTTG